MLLYPLEKQFDLPAASVKLGDSQGGQRKVVGQEDQALAGLGIFELDAAKRRVETLARIEDREDDGLIANQTGAAIDRMRIATLGFEIGSGARDKETARCVKAMKPLEIDVGAVHDVEGTGF